MKVVQDNFVYFEESWNFNNKVKKMNINDYQSIVSKTAIFPKEVGLAYCSLGLVDELGELAEKMLDPSISKAEKSKEAGDVYWYIAALAEQLEVDLLEVHRLGVITNTSARIEQGEDLIIALFILGAKIQGKVKKVYRDGDMSKKITTIMLLGNFYHLFTSYVEYIGFKKEEVLQENFDKLSSRLANKTLKGDGDNR